MTKWSAMIAAALALSACDNSGADRADDLRDAEGEVLGGTISDAMIPLESVKSQSPTLRVAPAEAGDDAADDAEEEDGSEGVDSPAAASQSAEPDAPLVLIPAIAARDRVLPGRACRRRIPLDPNRTGRQSAPRHSWRSLSPVRSP